MCVCRAKACTSCDDSCYAEVTGIKAKLVMALTSQKASRVEVIAVQSDTAGANLLVKGQCFGGGRVLYKQLCSMQCKLCAG